MIKIQIIIVEEADMKLVVIAGTCGAGKSACEFGRFAYDENIDFQWFSQNAGGHNEPGQQSVSRFGWRI